VDEKRLNAALEARDEKRRALLERLGVADDAFLILSVGKLTSRKRPHDLVHALQQLVARGIRRAHMVFAGDGPEKASLQAAITDELKPFVHLLGFVPVTEIPDLLSAVDVLIQPSQEDPHPLSISEALYCGLPVLASSGVGSVGETDDMRPGVNGFCFEIGAIGQIADALERLIADRALYRQFSEASLRISRTRNLETSLRGFLDAVHNSAPAQRPF
jgi:glycosyltransferase involved in cell wall biosynthesis